MCIQFIHGTHRCTVITTQLYCGHHTAVLWSPHSYTVVTTQTVATLPDMVHRLRLLLNNFICVYYSWWGNLWSQHPWPRLPLCWSYLACSSASEGLEEGNVNTQSYYCRPTTVTYKVILDIKWTANHFISSTRREVISKAVDTGCRSLCWCLFSYLLPNAPVSPTIYLSILLYTFYVTLDLGLCWV